MRLSVFNATPSAQLFIDLQKIYQGYLPETELTDKAITELIEDTNSQLFVTMFNNRHLGSVKITTQAKQAQLQLPCIREITRRRGVGKNLIKVVEETLQEQEIERVVISLTDYPEHELLTLQAFLTSLGYQSNGESYEKSL